MHLQAGSREGVACTLDGYTHAWAQEGLAPDPTGPQGLQANIDLASHRAAPSPLSRQHLGLWMQHKQKCRGGQAMTDKRAQLALQGRKSTYRQGDR